MIGLHQISRILSFVFDRGIFNPTEAETLERVLGELEGCGLDLSATKTLDLGVGEGFILAAFLRNSWQIYGVDNSQRAIDISARNLERAGLRLPAPVIEADYLTDDFWRMNFADGTRPQDIGLFYCHAYDGDYTKRILLSLGEEGHAKPESFAALVSGEALDDEFLGRCGYQLLNVGSDPSGHRFAIYYRLAEFPKPGP